VPQAPVETEAERRKREFKDNKNREELKRVWSEGFPISAPEAEPARLYLARRGLRLKYALSFPFLKYHPSMGYFHEGEVIGNFPCLIALVYDANGRPVTIHRTFITEEGFKAPVPSVKKIMPYPSDRTMTGGGIPLMDVQQFMGNCEINGQRITGMGVTEGIETALAVIEASEGKLPVWPLISSTLLEKFQVPEAVDMVCIYGDQDLNDAGREAAINLKERLIGENVIVRGFIPPKEKIPEDGGSVDWLDVLNHEGPDGIPKPRELCI
jgi:hypothetical protein